MRKTRHIAIRGATQHQGPSSERRFRRIGRKEMLGVIGMGVERISHHGYFFLRVKGARAWIQVSRNDLQGGGIGWFQKSGRGG